MNLSKLIFRVLHVGSIAWLAAESVGGYLLGPRQHTANSGLVFAVCGVVAIVSGVTNVVLLSPKKNMGEGRKLWVNLVYLKFALVAVALTPLLDKLLDATQWSTLIPAIRCYTCIFLIVLSAFMRFHREEREAVKRKQA